MYTSASWTQTIAMAKRCNSPVNKHKCEYVYAFSGFARFWQVLTVFRRLRTSSRSSSSSKHDDDEDDDDDDDNDQQQMLQENVYRPTSLQSCARKSWSTPVCPCNAAPRYANPMCT